MRAKRRTEQAENSVNRSNNHRSSRGWQFSLRSLLMVTAFVSICLAIGTYFNVVAFVLFALILIQVAILETLDWLIRPANRRKLAFVTVGLWTILGSGFLISGFKFAYGLISNNDIVDAFETIIFFSILAVPCYWLASRRWQRLAAYRRENL